jgi:hypothetical protein
MRAQSPIARLLMHLSFRFSNAYKSLEGKEEEKRQGETKIKKTQVDMNAVPIYARDAMYAFVLKDVTGRRKIHLIPPRELRPRHSGSVKIAKTTKGDRTVPVCHFSPSTFEQASYPSSRAEEALRCVCGQSRLSPSSCTIADIGTGAEILE